MISLEVTQDPQVSSAFITEASEALGSVLHDLSDPEVYRREISLFAATEPVLALDLLSGGANGEEAIFGQDTALTWIIIARSIQRRLQENAEIEAHGLKTIDLPMAHAA